MVNTLKRSVVVSYSITSVGHRTQLIPVSWQSAHRWHISHKTGSFSARPAVTLLTLTSPIR